MSDCALFLILIAISSNCSMEEYETRTWKGLTLLIIGVSLLLPSALGAGRTETVIDVSFVLAPGNTYGPYSNGTYYHTRVLSKPTLTGELTVHGAIIRFTAEGFNTQHLKNISVSRSYGFTINPADDLYLFSFDNTEGDTASSVSFLLEETSINILLLMPGSIGLLLTVIGIRKWSSEGRKVKAQA